MRFSLIALFMTVSGMAVVSLWLSPTNYTYVKTGRPNDITVIGEGWLYGVDAKTNQRTFLKSCTLSVNELDELIGNIGNRHIQIEPRILVPEAIERLRCSSDGQFTFDEESSLISIGTIKLAIARTSSDSFIFGDEELISVPHMKLADSSTGFIQSGWLLKQESILDRFQKISFGELAILIIAIGILLQLSRRRGGTARNMAFVGATAGLSSGAHCGWNPAHDETANNPG